MPETTWPLRSHLELGALPTALACARLHTKQVLWEWGRAGLSADGELIVSELTTNAVLAMAGWKAPRPIRLRLSSDTARVLIEVWDAEPRPPQPVTFAGKDIPAFDERGRGLLIVASLSKQWGWYPTQELGGKVVWAEVAE